MNGDGRRRRILGAGAILVAAATIALTAADRVRTSTAWLDPSSPEAEAPRAGAEGQVGVPAQASPVGAVAHAGAAAPVSAEAVATVEWSPERPVQGTIFTVHVRPIGSSIERVSGTLAGEPLHFEAGDGGAHTALAAVPVDANGEESLRLQVRTVEGRTGTITEAVPVAEGAYRMERLTVAPEYGGGYDAETQARIRRESARAREVSRRSHETPRMWEPPFMRPRSSHVTSGFGNGREFNGQVQSRHTGTDFAGGVGEPVRAAARGIVRIVDSFFLGGNVIYIDHGAGLVTAYLHLSEQLVSEGETVEAGQVIGRVGATGRVTGPHLHWIVRYGNISVDGLSLPGV